MTVTAKRNVYVIRVYRSDEASESGESGVELLEEHEFVSEHEARQCAHMLTHNAEGTVTFSPPQQAERDVAGYAIKSVTHDWTWTYSGITAEEAHRSPTRLSTGAAASSGPSSQSSPSRFRACGLAPSARLPARAKFIRTF